MSININLTNVNKYTYVDPLVSVIVPVYNEEDTIEEVLNKLFDLKKIMPMEIIIVDDGSDDDTSNILKKYNNLVVITHIKNLGKGAAIKNGILKSKGYVVVIQDADLEYYPEDIPKLVNPILKGKADVVYGSRFLGFMEGMSNSHYIGNRILSLFAQLLYGCEITDIMTGHKAIKRNIFNYLNISKKGFEVEIEITCKIFKNGFRFMEVPIFYRYRTKGKSKIKFWDGFNSLFELFLNKFLR